jgi:crossover junction endodeoxyribonuclease RuvC
MLVLGIDPGLATTGYGLVTSNDQELVLVEYGTLDTQPGPPLAERLQRLYHALGDLIRTQQPDVAAIEELFFSRNVRTAMTVGHARGVAMLAAAEAGLKVFEYTPLQVKDAVVGYGRASKGQVQDMVRLLLKLDHSPQPDDAADALAVAICHAHSARVMALFEQ